MVLYERIQEERRSLPEMDEGAGRELAMGHKRMADYISARMPHLPPGPYGYVSEEEYLASQKEYLKDLRMLAGHISGRRRVNSLGEALRYKGLQSKYPKECRELRNEYLGYGNYRQDSLL